METPAPRPPLGRSQSVGWHRERGLTILELIVYIGIITVVLTVAVATSLDLLRGRSKAGAIETVSQNARLALERITTVVRNADAINDGTSIFGTSPGKLSLQLPDPAVNPTVFDVAGGVLRIQEGTGPLGQKTQPRRRGVLARWFGGAPEAMAAVTCDPSCGLPVPLTSSDVSVDALTFTRLDDGPVLGVRVVLTISRRNPQGVTEFAVTQTYATAAFLR